MSKQVYNILVFRVSYLNGAKRNTNTKPTLRHPSVRLSVYLDSDIHLVSQLKFLQQIICCWGMNPMQSLSKGTPLQEFSNQGIKWIACFNPLVATSSLEFSILQNPIERGHLTLQYFIFKKRIAVQNKCPWNLVIFLKDLSNEVIGRGK